MELHKAALENGAKLDCLLDLAELLLFQLENNSAHPLQKAHFN